MSKNFSSISRAAAKTAGVVMIAGALWGVGAGVALADTPTDHPATSTGADPFYPNAKAGDAVFFNSTPWTATVSDPATGMTGSWQIAPGKTLLLTQAQLNRFMTPKVLFEVTPPGGSPDEYVFRRDQAQPGVQSCATQDGSSPNVGCISQAPNTLVGEGGPTQFSFWSADPAQTEPVQFDATAPGSDAAAMGNFLDGIAQIDSSWINFTPNSANAVSWGMGEQTLAGTPVWNCGAGEAHKEIGGGAEHSESTNVQGTISFEQGVKLFDAVDSSITVSISAGHSWTTTTSDSQTESKDIDPYDVGWLTSQPSTETVTGSVVMNGNAAKPITFTNVSFTEPGVNPTNNPNLNYTYVAHSRPMTQTEIAKQCGNIPNNVADPVVVGGTVPDVTAGATG